MNNYFHTMLEFNPVFLGWALIHLIWQGFILAFLLEIALWLVGQKNASLRYLLCGVALAAMPVCLLGTYGALDHGSYATPVVPPSAGEATIPLTPSHASPSGSALPLAVYTITDFTSHEISSFDLNRYMPWIVVGWLVGVILLSGRKAGGFIVLWRLRRNGISAPSEAMAELFNQACAKIGIDPQRVCLKVSTLIQVPLTMGWVRPMVLFPATLLTGLSAGEIELLLAHELAHIRRYDYLVNLLQTVVETLFFYHPVTWWISRRMRQERENGCDDMVASRSADVLSYAKVLLRLETDRSPGLSLAAAANGGDLLRRVQRLLGEPTPTPGMGLPVVLALVSILSVVTVISTLKAQATSTTPSTNTVDTQPAALSTENNDAPSAETIIKNTKAAYAALQSYSDTETIISQTNSSYSNSSIIFKIKNRLQRPGFYLIDWQGPRKGTAWSDGTGDYLYSGFPGIGMAAKKEKQPNRQATLISAGIASGAGITGVDDQFFNSDMIFDNGSLEQSGGKIKPKPTDYLRQKDEAANDFDCYVLLSIHTAPTARISTTLWIGKQDHLIHQIKTVMETLANGLLFDDTTLKKMLVDRKKSTTPEAIAALRKQYADIQEQAKGMKIESTESRTDIVTNKVFAPDDFKVDPH